MNKDIEFLREFKEEIIQAMELLKLLEDETDEQTEVYRLPKHKNNRKD